MVDKTRRSFLFFLSLSFPFVVLYFFLAFFFLLSLFLCKHENRDASEPAESRSLGSVSFDAPFTAFVVAARSARKFLIPLS